MLTLFILVIVDLINTNMTLTQIFIY